MEANHIKDIVDFVDLVQFNNYDNIKENEFLKVWKSIQDIEIQLKSRTKKTIPNSNTKKYVLFTIFLYIVSFISLILILSIIGVQDDIEGSFLKTCKIYDKTDILFGAVSKKCYNFACCNTPSYFKITEYLEKQSTVSLLTMRIEHILEISCYDEKKVFQFLNFLNMELNKRQSENVSLFIFWYFNDVMLWLTTDLPTLQVLLVLHTSIVIIFVFFVIFIMAY